MHVHSATTALGATVNLAVNRSLLKLIAIEINLLTVAGVHDRSVTLSNVSGIFNFVVYRSIH